MVQHLVYAPPPPAPFPRIERLHIRARLIVSQLVSHEEDGQPDGVNTKAKLIIHSGVQTEGGRMVQSKRGIQACYGQTIRVRPQAPAGVAGKGRLTT